LHYLQAVVFFLHPFPLNLILDFFFVGSLAALVEALLLPAGEGLLLFLWEVGAFFFDFGF
jgi:hypothetical protein